MVDNCHASRVALQGTARKIMNFFFYGDHRFFGEHNTIPGDSFPKKSGNRQKKVITFLDVTCSANRDQYE